MNRDLHRSDLGAFLKARRAELDPAAVGLPVAGPRRVAGLRREEVAVLAAISTDYYSRLEQGRIQASPPVLESLARVLRLDDDQRVYMYELAAKDDYRPPRRRPHPKVQPQLQRMLDNMALTPAFVIGPRTEIVAWNALGAAMITDFGKIPDQQRYYIRLLITDPAMRELYADWEESPGSPSPSCGCTTPTTRATRSWPSSWANSRSRTPSSDGGGLHRR